MTNVGRGLEQIEFKVQELGRDLPRQSKQHSRSWDVSQKGRGREDVTGCGNTVLAVFSRV